MGRLEYKYLVASKYKDSLREDIIPYLKHDYYSDRMPNKVYIVRSIYLDSPSLDSYYEKLSGVLVRNKFRVRGYNELTPESNVFAEIKRKENDYVTKDRTQVLYKNLNDFLNNYDISKVVNHSIEYQKRLDSARNFFFYLTRDKLSPIINVIYEREAFECKYGSGLRITFDMNVRSFITQSFDNLFSKTKTDLLYPNEFVFEVKFNKALPSWVPSIINKYQLTRVAVCPFCRPIFPGRISDS